MPQDDLAQFQTIPINQIVASKTNPRKRFPEDKLQELADNIKLHGIMQPILVRPMFKDGRPDLLINGDVPTSPHHYEIVAGERRWRAATIAGETYIPAIVRKLHDIEALQLQVFENLHRSDLHPMEEAEGFSQLLKKSQDLIGLTVDELALKVGKSRAYIYASLKLLDLAPELRTAFLEGRFSASIALLIARVPGSALQAEALKAITDYNDEVQSYRYAQRTIQNRFTLQLSRALFDITDATLVEAVGSCTDCPARSGNCRELFADIESPDICTRPQCFETKKKMHIERRLAASDRVITGEEADQIMPYGSTGYLDKGYCTPEHYCSGVPGLSDKDYKEILGDDLPAPTLIYTSKGYFAEAFNEEELRERVKAKVAAGQIEVPPEQPREPSKWEIEKAERETRLAPEIARRLKVFNALATKMDSSAHTLRMTLIHCIHRLDDDLYGNALEAIAACYGVPEEECRGFISRELKSKNYQIDDLVKLLALMTVANGIDVPFNWTSEQDNDDDGDWYALQSLAIANGIDPDDPEPEAAPTPSTAAQAQDLSASEEEKNPFEKIKAAALAKKARRQGKKESATADADDQSAAAAAEEEQVAA